MKKALFFCLLAGISLISNNSFGATCQAVTCPSSGAVYDNLIIIDNCLVAGSDSNGANKVCYKNASGTSTYYTYDCKQCPSGYTLKYITGKYSTRAGCYAPVKTCVADAGGGDDPTCPSTCPSSTSWKSTTGNKEARCDTSSTPNSSNQYKCEYRCKAGYYNSSAIVGLTSCSACPENATCAAGQDPKCNKGYYLENVASSGGGLISGQKKCTRCPPYRYEPSYVQMVWGTTVSSGSTSITQCYEPKGTDHADDTGKYEITTDKKCFYVK